jgi:adenylate kinase
MLIALSGTPGTGKSSISALLQKEGYNIINLNELAINQGFVNRIENKGITKIIDINKLNRYIDKNYRNDDLFLIEGHASHLLKVIDKVILLRCHPKKLKIRLEKKGWNKVKINENIEAETIDIILCEAVELHDKNDIFEIDTTDKNIRTVLLSIIEIIKSNFIPIKKYKIGKIDWSEEILNNY